MLIKLKNECYLITLTETHQKLNENNPVPTFPKQKKYSGFCRSDDYIQNQDND